MITSCLSCVSVSIEYFSNTYGWIIVREGVGPTFLGQEGWCYILDTHCGGIIIVHRGHDWTLLASGRDMGGCMEGAYILK